MSSQPQVSIVIPVHDDQEWISASLDSCLSQTLHDIEVICVDDASTDNTPSIIEEYAARDSRVRLIRMETNSSALQGRRLGIEAAKADYVLFADGDDELAPDAAKVALAKAQKSDADLVGFGVEVLMPDGQRVGGYQGRLRPTHSLLEGDDVVSGLFPVGKPAQGQLWRYLFSVKLLRDVYEMIPEGTVLRRVNDLPVMFLAAAKAKRYVSTPEQLYKYHFRRGGSGHAVAELAQFEFYLGAVDSVDSIRLAVQSLAESSTNPEPLLASYESARLSMIGNVLGYLHKNVVPELQAASLKLLGEKAPARDVVQAAVRYAKDAFEVMAKHGKELPIPQRKVQSVLLVTSTLTTGGVSGVLLSQARFLLAAGYKVTVAARREGSDLTDLPEGAAFVEVPGDDLASRLDAWAEICERESVDLIIDHQILYIREWPAYALMAKALGVATIGWIHNFALRPVYDQNTLSTFLQNHLNALATVVTLSPLDVAFWKLRGIEHAVYLPNPPSPMLLESAGVERPRSAPQGQIQLVWVGRLDVRTKQVRQLVEIAAELRRQSADFHLTIIGPDWGGYTAADLTAEIAERGLSDFVSVAGTLRGAELVQAIDAADMFVTTAVIEGYQLTLAETQARGLPVVMYQLPWLILVQDNEGIVAVEQGDAKDLAGQVVALAEDGERYERLSAASIEAAKQASAFDFSQLYQQLVEGALPAEFSPEPTLEDAKQLLDWTIFYAERDDKRPRGGRRRGGRGAAQPQSLPRRVARRVVRTFPAAEPALRRVGRALKR